MSRWDLHLSRSAAARVAVQAPPSYESIIASIGLELVVRCWHWERSNDYDEFKRAVFTCRVSPRLFDWFFNSRNSYRAQFYASEEQGLRANESFLRSVAPRLLSFAAHSEQPDGIRASILDRSAKVWIAESAKGPGSPSCPICNEGWRPIDSAGPPEILNDRWEHIRRNNGWGSSAPYLDCLRVIGAFISDEGNVWGSREKSDRAKQIHDTGWS